ncbi:MAG: hypothetical protein ACC726_13520 [Chloroflexota bacterium]
METDSEVVIALVEGGKSWLIVTVANFMPTFWALTLAFFFGRPYMMRVLRSLSLRFGADVWWLSYVLIRDAIMVIAFAVATLSLLPGLFINENFPVLAPLSSLVFFAALAIKLLGDADDDERTFRIVGALLVTGATLYFVPLFFGVQALEQEWLGGLPQFLVSATNPSLAWPFLLIAWVGYALIGGYIFTRFTRSLGTHKPQDTEGATEHTA